MIAVTDDAQSWFREELRLSSDPYAASAPTLQCAPSESTNCASTPPKSCFLGGMLNSTPLALISR